MSKKKKIILSIVALAAAVYAAAWLFLPYGRYKNFQETDCPWETEVSFPGIFSFSGSITMKLNNGASLIFEPGVFSGCDIFIFLRGGDRDYRIEADRELIPLYAVNEECEKLLDNYRISLLEMLSWAEENWDI